MGDRAVIEIHQEGGTVCLYSHSDGLYLREILAKALERGSGRWDDPQYLTRIIFNEMTKGREMETIGYGIHVGEAEELGPDNPTIGLAWTNSENKLSGPLDQLIINTPRGENYTSPIYSATEWIEHHNKEQACQ